MHSEHRIAIVEDKRIDSDKMRGLLEANHPCKVDQFFTQKTAQEGLVSKQYDLVIVDMDLGDSPLNKFGGLDILALLRGKPVSTLVVSGSAEESLKDMVIALRAYDYVSKPYTELTFLNKVQHALQWRPKSTGERNELTFSTPLPPNLRWNADQFCFEWKGKEVRLTFTELHIASTLISSAGHVVSSRKLSEALASGQGNALTAHISRIRNKFAAVDVEFDAIAPDPGKGYVWTTSTT